jgi:amidase
MSSKTSIPSRSVPVDGPLTDWSAEQLSAAIGSRTVSCREVMKAYLERIACLNPVSNAIVNLADEQALLTQADAHDAELAPRRSASGPRGWMHGFPQAIKDTGHALGFPTTLGSPLLARSMPTQDSIYVERMKAAGCIVIGKTNMPEFGLGSHSYNRLFGTTRNPWDPAVSAGGSSGGAAVALAQRMLPVADGSDFMGSLRNPAAWNHVFGLRPSQGRVPGGPKPELWVGQLGTDGPMARTVRDLAALLSTQAGADARAPLALAESPRSFVPSAKDAHMRGLRVAWLADCNGHLAMEPGILSICESALQQMEKAGARVEPLSLGFDADELWYAWLVWRRALVAASIGSVMHLPNARDHIKPEALWEFDHCQGLSFTDFMRASEVRSRLYQHLLKQFENHDVLALPAAQVWPFAIAETWPREIAGRQMDTYHRWMEVTLLATFAGLPAISVPAGFHANGRWPMGLQLIGRPRGDAALLAAAAGYEAHIPRLLKRRPGTDA